MHNFVARSSADTVPEHSLPPICNALYVKQYKSRRYVGYWQQQFCNVTLQ